MSFLKLEQITKSYKTNLESLTILKNLNLDVEASQVVAIVGQSGSGKSTLLSLLAGLDQVDSGRIVVNNTDVTKLGGEQLTRFRAKNIGIVFQQFFLVSHLNVYENLILPLQILNKDVDENFVKSLLEGVGLIDRIQHRPDQLSGGESQRLALARALVTKPQFILADEPSGSLDEETGRKVMDLFFDQVRQYNTTTILVTHDRDLANRCDAVYNLKAGQLERIK